MDNGFEWKFVLLGSVWFAIWIVPGILGSLTSKIPTFGIIFAKEFRIPRKVEFQSLPNILFEKKSSANINNEFQMPELSWNLKCQYLFPKTRTKRVNVYLFVYVLFYLCRLRKESFDLQSWRQKTQTNLMCKGLSREVKAKAFTKELWLNLLGEYLTKRPFFSRGCKLKFV